MSRASLLPVLVTLAFAAPGCRSAVPDRSTLTVIYPGDERDLGLPYDLAAKFLVFLPLTTENAQGELEPRWPGAGSTPRTSGPGRSGCGRTFSLSGEP